MFLNLLYGIKFPATPLAELTPSKYVWGLGGGGGGGLWGLHGDIRWCSSSRLEVFITDFGR